MNSDNVMILKIEGVLDIAVDIDIEERISRFSIFGKRACDSRILRHETGFRGDMTNHASYFRIQVKEGLSTKYIRYTHECACQVLKRHIRFLIPVSVQSRKRQKSRGLWGEAWLTVLFPQATRYWRNAD